MQIEAIILLSILSLFVLANKPKEKKIGTDKDYGIFDQHNQSNENKYGKQVLTEKGEIVKSKGEARIANYLHANNIEYIYEPKFHGMRPDFYLPMFKVFIEYFGMAYTPGNDGKKYRMNMKEKIMKYRGYKLLVILPQNLKNLDQIFRYKMQQLLSTQ